MRSSESIASLSDALVKAQAELQTVKKDKTAKVPTKAGGSYSYTYADLESILATIRATLEKHEIAVSQEAVSVDGGVGITTRLVHSSGEWLEAGPLVLPAGGTPQAYGSAVTYGRRYSLSAMLGIATEEDTDGPVETQGSGAVEAGGEARTRTTPPAAPAHSPEGPKATNPQKQRLGILAGDFGYGDDERRTAAGLAIGREITSFNDLSKSEASAIIDAWQKSAVRLQSGSGEPVDAPEAADGDGSAGEAGSAGAEPAVSPPSACKHETWAPEWQGKPARPGWEICQGCGNSRKLVAA